jgi:hypothetical protein
MSHFTPARVSLNSPPTYSQSRIVRHGPAADSAAISLWRCGFSTFEENADEHDDSGCRRRHRERRRRDAPPQDRLGRRLLGGQRRAGPGAFSIGSIAATVGKPSWAVWIISIAFGFLQSFSYAEIAGLFPHKSGGASVYGAVAWVRYSKMLAPLSVWCNWLAWSPVLAIGSGLAAGYILSILFAPDAAINTWQITLLDLGIKAGLSCASTPPSCSARRCCWRPSPSSTGASCRRRACRWCWRRRAGPLMLIGLWPLLSGDVPAANLTPLYPLAKDAGGAVIDGAWDMAG